MENAKGIGTSVPTNWHLEYNKDDALVDQKVYHCMISSLLSLCPSRPDIMLSVCMCARFQAAPKDFH